VVDVDWYVEDDQPKYRFIVDKEKASLNGVSAEQVAATLRMALDGMSVGLLHQPTEKEDVVIFLRLPPDERSSVEDLKQIKVVGQRGNLLALGELVQMEKMIADKSIYHKNLMPVVYVTGDVAGQEESPLYAIMKMDRVLDQLKLLKATDSKGGYPSTVFHSEVCHEVGWGMAYLLRGLPGPWPCLCRGAHF